ncbi:MAG: exodeoxyribonuclease VII small subunit [Lachnospiraceae bacterium]|nr:exodeoxyribonuclease VII small subunit [Lachnospiraceae bacterium]
MAEENNTAENLTVEQSFEKLEAMAARLESEDVTLEESFQLYEEGMKILKDLHERLDSYEKKMKILTGGVEEEF